MSTGAALRAYLAATSPTSLGPPPDPPPAELVGRAVPLPPAPLPELPPLPEEVVVYHRLKSAFIDFDALVASLRADRLTGYLRAQARDFEGVLMMVRGEIGLSCYRAEELITGTGAGERVRRRAVQDEVLLDVVRVRTVTAEMLPHLVVGPSEHLGLSRFVIVDELLAHLADERTDAAVVVDGTHDTGVVVMRRGGVDSAWTRLHPRPLTTVDAVLTAAREPTARIEIVRPARGSG